MVSLLSGCGELSYKRGASPNELEKTKQTCQTNSNYKVIEKCLEDNGWTLQKLGAFDAFEEIITKNDSQTSKETTHITDSKLNENIEKVTTANVPTQPSNKYTIKTSAKITPFNPLDTYIVNSWWKTGAKADGFKVDSSFCEAKLGEAHKLDPKNQTATTGFIVCMREKGWKAIKKLNQ